jgi:hypothetical protein
MNAKKIVKVTNIIPPEFCKFFNHVLLRKADMNEKFFDPQVPNVKAIMDHEIMFDTILEYLWQTIENIVGEQLIPTYSYARLYSNGDKLEKHVDRAACEISVTIQLGRSHDYSWPIFMDGNEYSLNEGEGIIYSGCDTPHWRNVCSGPEKYYSGQIFLHYVKANGKYANEASDKRNIIFVKNRI